MCVALLLSQRDVRCVATDAAVAAAVVEFSGVAGVVQADDIICLTQAGKKERGRKNERERGERDSEQKYKYRMQISINTVDFIQKTRHV